MPAPCLTSGFPAETLCSMLSTAASKKGPGSFMPKEAKAQRQFLSKFTSHRWNHGRNPAPVGRWFMYHGQNPIIP